MSGTDREALEDAGWGIERAQVRGGRAQRNHLGLALRAFLRLEANRLENGVSWYEAELSIVREAVRSI